MATIGQSAVERDEANPLFAGWRVVLGSLLALTFGPSTIAVLGFGLFIKPLEAEFGWPRTQITLATTIVSYMIVLASPLQGWLVDRFGVRRVMLPSIPIFAAAVAGLSQLPANHTLYYLAWGVMPFLGVGLFPLTYLRAVASWFNRRLGLALGIANSGVALGGAVIPLIAGYFIRTDGWRSAFLALSVAVLLTWPIAWALVREQPRGAGTAKATAAGFTLGAAARTPTFVLMAAAFLLLGFINTAMIVHQAPLLLDAGMSPVKVATVQATLGMAGIIGRLVSGYLIDMVPARILMAVLTAGAAVACGLYASGVHGDLAFLCAALIGLVFGAEFDVLGFLVKQRFGIRSFGRIYGVIFAIFQFGAGCGAAFLPMTRAWTGTYSAGLWGFCVAMLLCAVVFVFLPRPQADAQFQ